MLVFIQILQMKETIINKKNLAWILGIVLSSLVLMDEIAL